ncbi:CpaF family protein [Actinomadura sp. 3N407]|uniref:CpaF family protein n=1 Tax=Actinomadura sp. 3N407 TaxID=3457423 RepID=UPI003FCC47BB
MRPAAAPTGVWPARSTAGAAPAATAATAEERLDDDALRTAVKHINTVLDEVLLDAEPDDTRTRLAVAEQVRSWAQQQANAGRILLPATEQQRVTRAVLDDRFGLGVLQPLLDDADIEEIDINGPRQVWLRYAGARKAPGPAIAESDDELADKVRRWAARTASPREFSSARPLLNVALGVGVRMAATMSVTTGTHVSIRKQRLMKVTLDELVGRGTIDQALHAFLAAAVRARLDILVTGGVAAGKTTFLRALCSEFDPSERIITLESERELYLDHLGRHEDVVSFEAREANQEGVGAITLTDLIPQVLRMNPDRILVGEVRHAEMLALLQAIDNGLEGSLTTLHANSGPEVFGRLLTLCAYADQHPEPTDLFRLIGRAVDLVVHLRRDHRTGQRYVSEAIEVLEPADGHEPAINRIFVPGPEGQAVPAGVTPKRVEELELAGFDRRLLTQAHPLWEVPSAGGRR